MGLKTLTLHTADPWKAFAGYVFVVISNIVVAYVVLWLFLRDRHSVTGACRTFGTVLVLAYRYTLGCFESSFVDCLSALTSYPGVVTAVSRFQAKIDRQRSMVCPAESRRA